MFNWGIRNGYLEKSPFKIGMNPRSPSSGNGHAIGVSRTRRTRRGYSPQIRISRRHHRVARHEAGVPISYTSKILGHTNLSTTSRYLNIHRRGLQEAMRKLEEHRCTTVAQRGIGISR
jgi:integrase